MISQIDVEALFDVAVEDCGGVCVKSIVGKSPAFENADYVFHECKLVGELKCLQRDRSDDSEIKERLRRQWIKWRQAGLVKGQPPREIDSRQLPMECQNQMYEILGRSIKRRIQKANKQIRATKEALGLTEYRGVLFLANDGNFMFEPAAMIHFIQLTLKRNFSEIRDFIFFTVNIVSRMDGKPVFFWICFNMDDAPSFDRGLFERLHQRWMTRHSEAIGLQGFVRTIEDMGDFWDSRYLR